MRKTIIAGLLILVSLTLVYGFADARVSGPCVNCHTMHNSQGGTQPTTWDLGVNPRGSLVANSCLGCHTTDGSDPRPTTGGLYVKSSTSGAFTDNNCLSGGFFPYTDESSDNHASKAHSLGSKAAPAGYSGSWYEGTTNGLTCAGTNGCHGLQTEDDESTAIKGGHHGENIFRILYAYDGTNSTEVRGKGAPDYEKALIKAVTAEPTGNIARTIDTAYGHNIYKAGSTGDTISKLCANCHGDFHTDVGSSGAWTRHPTDQILPTGWTVQTDAFVTDYDCKYNPYGFASDTSTAGKKYVTCLSCHRAHGTEKFDLLRFNYNPSDPSTLQVANSGANSGAGYQFGCLACHNKQR